MEIPNEKDKITIIWEENKQMYVCMHKERISKGFGRENVKFEIKFFIWSRQENFFQKTC